MGEWGKYLMIIIISADGEERGVDRLDGEGRFDPRSVEGGREGGGRGFELKAWDWSQSIEVWRAWRSFSKLCSCLKSLQ